MTPKDQCDDSRIAQLGCSLGGGGGKLQCGSDREVKLLEAMLAVEAVNPLNQC